MVLSVVFGSLGSMLLSVLMVRIGRVGVVGGLFVLAFFVVLGCCVVVLGGLLMVLCGLVVVLGSLMRCHGTLLVLLSQNNPMVPYCDELKMKDIFRSLLNR